jgi:hypothetical protein
VAVYLANQAARLGRIGDVGLQAQAIDAQSARFGGDGLCLHSSAAVVDRQRHAAASQFERNGTANTTEPLTMAT